MQNKRSPWMSIVLGLMLFSLIIFSGLPLVNSIFLEGKSDSIEDSIVAKLSPQEQSELAAEAKGYKKVLLREPENETALRELLNIRLQQQDLEGAIAPLETLAQIHPEQSEYGVLLGQAKQYRQDNEGAAAAYREVLATNPDNVMALGGLVNLFLNQDLPEKAIALLKNTLDRVRKQDDESPYNLNSIELLLGEVYTEAEKYEKAIAIYDQIRKTDEADFRPVMAKALVLQKQEKNDEAKDLLQTAYELAPIDFKDQIKAAINDKG